VWKKIATSLFVLVLIGWIVLGYLLFSGVREGDSARFAGAIAVFLVVGFVFIFGFVALVTLFGPRELDASDFRGAYDDKLRELPKRKKSRARFFAWYPFIRTDRDE
jgi:hypothetical protein